MAYVNLYDTTLRDGAQSPGVRFTTDGRLEATRLLDGLGVDYIEGGFPQAGGLEDYFQAVRGLKTKARIAAFGMTPRGRGFENDPAMAPLVNAGTSAVALVAKTPERQIREILKAEPAGYRMLVSESVSYLRGLGREIIVDAEHFFDAYRESRAEALGLLDACGDADWLVLCDTNGGAFYRDVARVVRDVIRNCGDRVGVHFHHDRGLSLPCTLEAAYAGARQVQTAMNSMGERAGNANTIGTIANLWLQGFGMAADPKKLTHSARRMEKLSGWSIMQNAPLVGQFAFAHSGGMHSDAMLKDESSYEFRHPAAFGNERSYPISGQSGRAAIVMKLRSWGYDLGRESHVVAGLLDGLNGAGCVGDAQFYQMFRRRLGNFKDPIEIERINVTDTITSGGSRPEAFVKLRVAGRPFHEVSEGDGQVDAFDGALRKALLQVHPEIDEVKLLSYTVPPITGTGASARVTVRACFGNGCEMWDSFRDGTDVVRESALALTDAYNFFLLRQQDKNR